MNEEVETELENRKCRAIVRFTDGKYCDEETRKWFNLEMLKEDNQHHFTRIWGWYAKGGGACAPIYFDTVTRNFYTMAVLEDTGMMYKSGCNPDDLLYFIRKKPEPCPCEEEKKKDLLYFNEDDFDKAKFGELKKDHWKLIPNLEFERKKADFGTYLASRLSLLKDANKKTVIGDYFEQETMDLCIDGVRRQLEERFKEWCNKLLE